MKRGELIYKIVDDIVRRVDAIHPFSQEWKDRYAEEKLKNVNSAITWCLSITEEPYRQVIVFLKNYTEDVDNYDGLWESAALPIYTLSVRSNKAHKKRFKKICTYVDPFVVTLSVFRDDNNRLTINGSNWKVFERIWFAIVNDDAEKDKFWDELKQTNRTIVYIQTNQPDVTREVMWNMYSYAYLSVINNDAFPIPDDLARSILFPLRAGMTYQPNAKYDQFFDVYDVLNEVKYAPDLLTEFVKVYQVLELLAYRNKFQGLIESHIHNKYPIVRQIESLTDSFKQNELKEFENFFKDILDEFEKKLDPKVGDDYPEVPSYLSDCVGYIDSLYNIKLAGGRPLYTNRQVADIIYKIRCSIVHNKETEFHFTYNNVEEYHKLVPLIRKLNELLLVEIMDIINNGDKLVYEKKNLTLY